MASRLPFRVLLTHRGIGRKFFTLFQGGDGSLYIRLYRPDSQPWRIPGVSMAAPNEMRLNFADFQEPGFELHKISFHPSGFVHLTNKRGERFKDGRGPAFEEMGSPFPLCVLAPCKLEHLPKVENEKGLVVDLILPDTIAPFYTTLSLIKGDGQFTASGDTLLAPVFILPLNSGHKLAFVLRMVRNVAGDPSENWPPFPFFLFRIAA